jgi:DNA recombination protein RmuC
MTPLDLILILALIITSATLFFLWYQSSIQQKSGSEYGRLEQTIQQLVHQVTNDQSNQLQNTVNLVLQQLSRQQEAYDRSTGLVHHRLDQTNKLFADVQSKLSQQEESVKRLIDFSKDLSNLQTILQAPKLRGNLGEIWLEQLIGQIMPRENYKMQYSFKNGEICDAVIFLHDGMLLPIDSKFSLENFVKMMDAEEGSSEQSAFRKQFIADSKRRIDEIASKYIRPKDGTLEFAFMYVPAENVYYHAFIQQEDSLKLLGYAFDKKVIPVSPSSFYPYLQVVLFGLNGLKIEKQAATILQNLAHLEGHFGRFREQYEKIGTHLKNAQGSYDQAEKRLHNFERDFDKIAVTSATVQAKIVDGLNASPVSELTGEEENYG